MDAEKGVERRFLVYYGMLLLDYLEEAISGRRLGPMTVMALAWRSKGWDGGR